MEMATSSYSSSSRCWTKELTSLSYSSIIFLFVSDTQHSRMRANSATTCAGGWVGRIGLPIATRSSTANIAVRVKVLPVPLSFVPTSDTSAPAAGPAIGNLLSAANSKASATPVANSTGWCDSSFAAVSAMAHDEKMAKNGHVSRDDSFASAAMLKMNANRRRSEE